MKSVKYEMSVFNKISLDTLKQDILKADQFLFEQQPSYRV